MGLDHLLSEMLAYGPLVLLLSVAAGVDLRTQRIPNWLCMLLACVGLFQSFLPHAQLPPAQSMLGLLTGFAWPLLLFLVGAMGAGDVKLFAAVGAWTGPADVSLIFGLSAIVGAIIVIVWSLARGKLIPVLRSTFLTACNLVFVNRSAAAAAGGAASGPTSRQALPYAIAIWAATLLALFTPVLSLVTGRQS